MHPTHNTSQNKNKARMMAATVLLVLVCVLVLAILRPAMGALRPGDRRASGRTIRFLL